VESRVPESRAGRGRRRYGLELGFGIGLALAGAWLLQRTPGRGAGAGRAEVAGPEPAAPQESAALVHGPEVIRASPRDGATRSASRERRATAAEADELCVLVLDASGRPAPGMPVLLTGDEGSSARAQVATDERGLARLPLGGLRRVERAGGSAEGFRVRAVPSLPGAPELRLAHLPAPGETLELRLPPCGRLRVVLLGEDGKPCLEPAVLDVRLTGADGKPTSRFQDFDHGRTEMLLEPGLDLTLGAYRGDRGTRPAAPLELAGPRADGDVVEASLVLGQTWPRLAWRALDEEGRPLGGATLRVRIDHSPLSPQLARVRADPDGRCELIVFGSDEPRGPRPMELETDAPPRLGEVSLAFELAHARTTELGDVVLQPGDGQLVVGGRVLVDGRPAPGAQVRTGWKVSDRVVTSDADGRFELRAYHPPEGDLQLWAQLDGWVQEKPVRVPAGSDGVVLELVATAKVTWSVLLDPGRSENDVGVWLLDEERGVPLILSPARAPPGTYRVLVTSKAGNFPLADLGLLRLEPGATLAPPQLASIDLRGALVTAGLRLLDEAGQPLSGCHVELLPLDPVELAGRPPPLLVSYRALTPKSGRLTLVVPPLAVVVLPRGYQPQPVTLREGLQELRFRR